ncbi:MAG: flagellar basal body rod protein FlgB [Desulfobacterales bacterium]|nr:flagellar basal body rod protein FlgB [Desulfobacterales bacterium]MCP4159526.1 flagellar basal body rod protein FlgB [Deltaproteobacteria bacterium]
MADNFLFNNTYSMLGKSMDISTKRHSMISSNLANMDTIGYKSKDIDFQKALKVEMEKTGGLSVTDKKHFDVGVNNPLEGEFRENDDPYNIDPVNIDTEMNNLIENNIKFKSNVEMMLRKVGILRHAIAEGGR